MNAYITNLHLSPTPGVSGQYLVIDDTAGGVSLTASNFTDKTKVVTYDIKDASCFVTFDGSPPTSTNGHELTAGTRGEFSLETAKVAKFIRATTTNSAIYASPLTV